MQYATCCEQASQWVERCGPDFYLAEWDKHDISFCPFCGTDLKPLTLEQALRLLAESEEKVTICFDVDGVLCDDRDPTIPYDERPPYSWVAEVLGILKAHGHTIHVQTARYMEKFDGNQEKAIRHGELELRTWLRFHGIPYDRAYLGKASAHIYADDRGCQIISNRGTTHWSKNLLPRIAAIQAQRSKRANLRV